MGTSSKDYALHGRNGNTLKIKTTATSIATVRDLCPMYATFLTPLGSHYRLPLNLCYEVNISVADAINGLVVGEPEELLGED
jgi:hypothetical protein